MVGPGVMKRSPAAQLAGLKAFIGEDGFQWKYPPGSGFRGRGVYPTWAHVRAWYDDALWLGFDPEDIGFTYQDLYVAWHDYVEDKWPGDRRNNAIFDINTTHANPFDPGFQFPDQAYPQE